MVSVGKEIPLDLLRRGLYSPVKLSMSVSVSPAQSADSRQWCSSSNTLAEMNQGLEWKGIGHASGVCARMCGQWIAHLSLEIEPVHTQMNAWAHAHPDLPWRQRARNRATVWTLSIRMQSWWSPSLTSVTPLLPPLRPPFALCDWVFISSSRHLVRAVTSSLSLYPPLCHLLFHPLPLPWGCRFTCLPHISLILWLDSLFPLSGL